MTRRIFRRVSCAVLMLVASLLGDIAQADADSRTSAGVTTTARSRPRICVALSGGGARGYAHVGVLQQLEALHVPIDCIAGTSMGAVIGALYASGMSADAIKQALSKLDLENIAFDVDQRQDLPQSSRDDSNLYPINLPMGFSGARVKLSTGLVQGNKLTALLRTHTGRFPADVDFDRLPIPYRAVATDLETGERVVLNHGSLSLAARASMAVPGLFAPVKVDGRTLIDGGAASNLPIDVARQMGADIVIAVDIGTQLKRADQLESMTAVTSQMIRLMMTRDVLAQKATLRSTDVLLEPDLGSVSFSDFGEMEQGVAAGAESVKRDSARLAAISLGDAQYAAWRADLPNGAALPPGTHIDRIEVATRSPIPPKRIEQALDVRPGDVYDPAGIESKLADLASSADFQSVSQSLTGPPGERVLRVEANEKNWGPNFLLFGFAVSTNFDDEGAFAVHIGHRRPWLTDSGLSWRNDVVIGSRALGWRTELRQPVFGEIYVAPYASIRRNDVNLYDDDNLTKYPLASFAQQTLRAGVDVGVPLGTWGEARAGIAQVHTSYSARSMLLAQTDNDDGSSTMTASYLSLSPTTQTVASAGLKIDQLDDPVFPRHGFYVDTRLQIGLGSSNDSYNLAFARGMWAASHRNLSMAAAYEVGGQLGNNHELPGYLFSLGGFQRLSAYAQDQFNGGYIMYGRLTGRAQLSKVSAGPLGGVFAGISLEGGNVWKTSQSFARGPWLSSISAFIGTSTMIGPIYLGFAMAPRGVNNVYFQLGNRF
jgi:NTE family protein